MNPTSLEDSLRETFPFKSSQALCIKHPFRHLMTASLEDLNLPLLVFPISPAGVKLIAWPPSELQCKHVRAGLYSCAFAWSLRHHSQSSGTAFQGICLSYLKTCVTHGTCLPEPAHHRVLATGCDSPWCKQLTETPGTSCSMWEFVFLAWWEASRYQDARHAGC